jgi:hypothetical protein
MVSYNFGTIFRIKKPSLLGSTGFYILTHYDHHQFELINLEWGTRMCGPIRAASPYGITREELERYAEYFFRLGYIIEALKDCKLTFTVPPVVVVEEETVPIGWQPWA